jgi:PAS domain S-box-containing protein
VATVAVSTGRARIQRLVEERTREVRQAYATLAQEAKERLWAVAETQMLERRLRQIIDLVPNMIYVKDWFGRFLLANQAAAEAHGTTVERLTAARRVDLDTAYADPDQALSEERKLMQDKGPPSVATFPFIDARGRHRIQRQVRIPCSVFGSDTRALLCVATDITEQKQREEVLRVQNALLRQLAQGADPDSVLVDIVAQAEEIAPGMRCSVLLLGEDRRLHMGSAPSLPDFYNEAIEGLPIGPRVGSCGAAAATGERVVVEDVRTHPNWEPYREIAARAGLRACWSQPIRAANGEVLGTFAMYYAEARGPEPFELELMESMAYLAGIAIERGRQAAAH